VLRRYTWSQCKSDRSRIEAVVGHRRASGASTDTCDPTVSNLLFEALSATMNDSDVLEVGHKLDM
jgi:hypothetical protein